MWWRSSIFILILILTLASTGRGCRIHLASKIPCYLFSYLSICHSWNYGVKMRKFHGRWKDPLSVSSTKRYFKPRPSRLPYGTIYGNHGLHINNNEHGQTQSSNCPRNWGSGPTIRPQRTYPSRANRRKSCLGDEAEEDRTHVIGKVSVLCIE